MTSTRTDSLELVAPGPSSWGWQAAAQSNCAPREIVIERLGSKFSETLSGAGLQSATTIFEVWRSEEKGTWTILRTFANGQTCVMASGTSWRDAVKVPSGVPG